MLSKNAKIKNKDLYSFLKLLSDKQKMKLWIKTLLSVQSNLPEIIKSVDKIIVLFSYECILSGENHRSTCDGGNLVAIIFLTCSQISESSSRYDIFILLSGVFIYCPCRCATGENYLNLLYHITRLFATDLSKFISNIYNYIYYI